MNLDLFYKKLGERIQDIRKSKHYTQEQLSEKANISLDYLGKIERNINKPGLVALFKIISALEISFSDFFKGI